jgi:CRISPR/Cas system CMR subunit Cmr6 (Cas7 group RAMP superfamily)
MDRTNGNIKKKGMKENENKNKVRKKRERKEAKNNKTNREKNHAVNCIDISNSNPLAHFPLRTFPLVGSSIPAPLGIHLQLHTASDVSYLTRLHKLFYSKTFIRLLSIKLPLKSPVSAAL